MQQSHPPISGRTRLYGLFADPVGHLQTPAVLNSLLDQRGVDAVFVALHVTAEHFAATVAGMRHLRNFAGYGVSIPHKPMAARLCDELLPNARACGVVNVIRVDSDGRWIGETLDGVGMVKAITAQRALNANTRVLLVGAGGVGRAIAVALALAGVGYLAIANRTGPRLMIWPTQCGVPHPPVWPRPGALSIRPPSISSSMQPPWGSMDGPPARRGLECVWDGLGRGSGDGPEAHAAVASRPNARSRDRARPRDADPTGRGRGGLSRHDRSTKAKRESESVVFALPCEQ